MESRKISILAIILPFFSLFSVAQENPQQYIHRNLSRTTLTFSTGYLTASKVSSVYLTGNIEYYTNPFISVRGDGYLFINNLSVPKNTNTYVPNQNHNLLFGALYHFKTNNHFDPYAGLQPGIALSQSKNNLETSSITANPIISPSIGFNYYAKKYAHLFIHARYISGNHLSDARQPMRLNEIRFEFGLGFNLF